MDDDTDLDTALAYYMFVNHGTFPGAVAAASPRERAMMFVMARKEIKSRKT